MGLVGGLQRLIGWALPDVVQTVLLQVPELTQGKPERIWGATGIKSPLRAYPGLLPQERADRARCNIFYSSHFQRKYIFEQNLLTIWKPVLLRGFIGILHGCIPSFDGLRAAPHR